VRAIVVEKRRIYSLRLKTDKESFYEFFVKQMMRHDNGGDFRRQHGGIRRQPLRQLHNLACCAAESGRLNQFLNSAGMTPNG
jgi:hypothetical protein